MTGKERAVAMRNLAKAYHAAGMNVVPLGQDKRPVITKVWEGAPVRLKWETWRETFQSERLFAELLSPSWWTDVYGIAGVCGPVSGNLVCIDFDSTNWSTVEEFLRSAGLPERYKWTVKTPGGGWHVWTRTSEDVQIETGKLRKRAADGVGFVEFRWTGHYTALPGSMHPNGGIYEFAFGNSVDALEPLEGIVAA